MARVKLGDDDEKVIVVDRGTSPAKLIRVEDLQGNPENPRPTDLEVADMEESLRLQGQLHNINVMSRGAFLREKRYLADSLNDKPYVVVNGRRRMLAAPAAGLEKLKYELRDNWTAEQIDRATILENEDRLDVNPLHLGRYLKRMLAGYESQRKLAQALGKGQAWVQQRIGLTTLHEDLQKVIDQGRIHFALARHCTRLAPELQPRLAAGDLPVDVAQAWLVTLKLKPEEQLARFAAGPPFDIEPTPPAQPEDMPEPADDEPTARDEPAEKRPRPIVIRIAERSPTALAGALRETFTEEEIVELVQALTGGPTGSP